jgi:hypothetical protein
MGKLAAVNSPAETRHGIQPGAVFVEEWGYDQTNVDCYVVVGVTNTMVELKPCGHKMVGQRVLPDPTNILEFRIWSGDNRCRIGTVTRKGTVRKRVTTGWRGEPWLHMTSYSGASLWDGERTYFDTIDAGYPGH